MQENKSFLGRKSLWAPSNSPSAAFKKVELLSWERCFILVSKDKVDVALSTPQYAALLMKKHNITNVEEKPLELGDVKFYLWLNKEHHLIAEQLTDIFIKMKADGQLGLF